ncbi:Transposon Ty3-I Gag-Pol polyprotein [Labeo rohita]|uniref:Gypsy retrotransposon integrase-like protein 1 n=1 Tax=Labeo rohita TaxID=84645 RepID=A0ABQ8L0F5_LABRO|nr:Transposon Ty3-I Gag-Pol polyprotein [Labeo rohita]
MPRRENLRSQCQTLLGTAHQSPGSGHPGSKRTLSLLQTLYWWPSMRRDTTRYVQSCSVCAMSNSPRQLPTEKLVPLPIVDRLWSQLGIDFVTSPARKVTRVLVIVDQFSKACKFPPLKGLPTALETAEHLFQQVFRHFGIPEEIVISHVWKAFFKLLGVSVNLSSGYHPQTNGQTERKIQELGRYLRAYCHEDQHSWSRFLLWQSTHRTPFAKWAVRRHKHFADARRRIAPTYQPGDQVWLSTRDLRLRLPCRKLSPRYIGPFKILRQINDVTFQLQLPPRYRIHPTFHVSLLKPFFPSATETPGAKAEPPPPEVLDQTSIYTVHDILDSRRRGGHLEYLIDWEGYGPKVDVLDVLDPTLLLYFHRDHPDRPAPRSHGHPQRRVRASGAVPGGGGSVRHSPQPPPPATSPVALPTRSSSPEFYSPAPNPHQPRPI